MKLSDYIDLSFSNLWKRKLRTFLTTCGVIIGIGALVTMFAFGKGVQKKVTDQFRALELFNYVTVFAEPINLSSLESDPGKEKDEAKERPGKTLDDSIIAQLQQLPGVEAVLPDIRFPATIRLDGDEEFSLIQVLPARFATSKLMKLREGKPYQSDDENSLILSDSMLHRLGVKDFEAVIGKSVRISTLVFDFSRFSMQNLPAMLQGEELPFAREEYEFVVAGVSERMGFGGPSPLRSDVYIPSGTSQRMKKLPVTNLLDIFKKSEGGSGYSVVNIRLESPARVEPVKKRVEQMGFRAFAMLDQFEEIRTGFLFMDMFLAAVGMIAIVVASLGIVNTMVMSILERFSEIGIMKAVGARDIDIKKIFFFESCVIGFLGGIFGLALGWVVSRLINQIVNMFLARQGVPFMEYFSFPLWICLGAVVFSVLVSLVSGMYPAARAARIDPVVALRHD